MLSSWVLGRAGLAISMGLGLVPQAGLRAEHRAPVAETVDLVVPISPMTVAIAGRIQIVHELHITNFLPVEITLRRVQVVSGDRSAASLADYREEALRERIGRPGLPRNQDDPDRVGPGMRAIVYFWIELAADTVTPSALRHRVEMEIQRPAGPVRAVVEGAVSNVSAEKAVALAPPLRGGPWTAIYDPNLKARKLGEQLDRAAPPLPCRGRGVSARRRRPPVRVYRVRASRRVHLDRSADQG